MTTAAAELVAQANARIENLSVTETADALERDSALLVDIREASEREQEGYVAGAIHTPRALLTTPSPWRRQNATRARYRN